jgi:hypothetical protein
MTDRKKPGVAFWATVALVVVLLYPLSLAPVCRIMLRPGQDYLCAPRIYWPLGWAISKSDFVNSVTGWYVGSMMPNSVKVVAVPFMPSGGQWVIGPLR